MKFFIRFAILLGFIAFMLHWGYGQTKSSATLTQTVSAAAPIAAKVTLTSSVNPSAAGQLVTYNGTVTGTNNGASPTGTVVVVGATGSQTVALTASGAYTCSETIAAPGTYTITATYSGDKNFF